MIRSLTATNYLGESIKLDLRNPYSTGLAVKGVEGLGPSKADINLEDFSSLDGSSFNSARMPSRYIRLNLALLMNPDVETSRYKTYKYFPLKKPIHLLFETDRRLAEITGYVEMNEPSIFSRSEETVISIACPYPYFYSAGENGLQRTVLYGIKPLFEFSFMNNDLVIPLLEFSSIERRQESSVLYTGDADTGVVIEIYATGAASNITIHNTGSKETMFIDSTKLAQIVSDGIKDGDKILINTERGAKFIHHIRDNVTTNIINALGPLPDWFRLVRGDNVFAFTATSGDTNLQVSIFNRTLYEGI